jgi:hypothetical protein
MTLTWRLKCLYVSLPKLLHRFRLNSMVGIFRKFFFFSLHYRSGLLACSNSVQALQSRSSYKHSLVTRTVVNIALSCTANVFILVILYDFRLLPAQFYESESYVTTDGQSASVSCNKAPIWALRPDFYYCQESCGFVDVVRSLWREDGSVVCSCC